MPTVHFVSRKLLGELLVGKHGLPWEITGITKKPKTIASTSSASAGEASSAVAASGANAAPPPAPPGSSKSILTFLDRVDFLKVYKEKHGHFRVRPKEDRHLYDFCYRVRRARREGYLSEQRVADLDAIGFDWEMERVVPSS